MTGLYEAMVEHPNINCFLSHKAKSIEQDENLATLTFENGVSKSYGSVLCADGIHSIGQKLVFADEVTPVINLSCPKGPLVKAIFRKSCQNQSTRATVFTTA